MKSLVFSQYSTVKANTDALFTAKLNEEVYRLKDKSPNVKFSTCDPLTAYIEYTETETQPEPEKVEKLRFVCEQCPHFKPILKADGTIDERCKYGDCDYDGNEFGRSLKKSEACSHLYDLLKEGKGVRICFK